ncbi:MAG: NAD(P)-binding domain-containing protein [Rhodoplanes sp.]
MRIGILGSGLMGGKLGTLFARVGHEVVFSYARSTEMLKRLAKDAIGNARVGTPREAAQDADALLLAVHWSRIDDVLHQAGDLSGKVIVSCSLPMNADNKLQVRLSRSNWLPINAQSASTKATIRRRWSASGKGPRIAPRLSIM